MDVEGFRPGTERSITLHTCDRLRQWPRVLKGHAALQLPTAVPVALGQADRMVTTRLLTVQSSCEGRRDTQGRRRGLCLPGCTARARHCASLGREAYSPTSTVP